MRKDKEIKERLEDIPDNLYSRKLDKIKVELLLDIRQLLVELRDALLPEEFRGQYLIHSHPPIRDCNFIPDPKKLMKHKKRLDELLGKKK